MMLVCVCVCVCVFVFSFCLFGDVAFSEYFLYHFRFLFVSRVRRTLFRSEWCFLPCDHELDFDISLSETYSPYQENRQWHKKYSEKATFSNKQMEKNNGKKIHVVMFVCMVTHIARVWINRVRLPIMLVVSWTEKINISLSAFAPKNLVRETGSAVPSPFSLLISILKLNLLLAYEIPPEFCGGVHLFI